MSEREHDDQHEEHELYEEVPPRSIFAATWFRVLLVVIVVGVIGAVAIPYVLDFMNPPPSRPAAAKVPAPSAAPTPATPAPEKPAVAAPAATAPPAAPVETKPAPATARPVETKPATPKPEPPKTAAATAERSKPAMAVTELAPKPAPMPAKPEPVKPDPVKPDAAKPDAAKADTAKPAVTLKTDTLAKADTKLVPNDDVKPAVATKPATVPKRVAATSTTTASRPATGASPFWVQVGAYRDAETAKKVAAKLREDKFNVEESVARTGGAPAAKPAPAPSPTPAATAKPEVGDQYDVFVTGQTPEELNKRLAAKGLAAEASGAGMVVKPSLSLRDAVALSKDLAVEGFKVQVRRAGSSMAAAPSPSAPAALSVASAGGAELHRVRVGAFADRAAAQEAMKQLEAKGYKPYIARGDL